MNGLTMQAILLQGAQGGAQSMLGALMLPVAFIAIFYFLLIRPMKKKQKAQENMLAALKKGDKVIISGGIFGAISRIDEREMVIEIADDVRVRVLRSAVVGLQSEPAAAVEAVKESN